MQGESSGGRFLLLLRTLFCTMSPLKKRNDLNFTRLMTVTFLPIEEPPKSLNSYLLINDFVSVCRFLYEDAFPLSFLTRECGRACLCVHWATWISTHQQERGVRI